MRRNLVFPLRMMKLPRPEITAQVERTAQLLSLSELLCLFTEAGDGIV
ncbi:MAG: hypothetical protein KDI49_11725 [Gammaproteobacteria bacterium]|nr:hypothetical protein [Gammaproteobacteria bacterium]